MKVLAISGSLRAASINSALCRVVAQLAPPSLQVTVFTSLSQLPFFNPDQEPAPPREVCAFRALVGEANALLIASPEYAHGISGTMKNALDWLVSYEGMVGKHVAIFNASPRAHHAHESLEEILRTMSANLVAEASANIPILSSSTTEEAMLCSASISNAVRGSLDALAGYLNGDETGKSMAFK